MALDDKELRTMAIKAESDIDGLKRAVTALERKTSALERAILGDKYTGGRAIRELLQDVEARLVEIELQNNRLRLLAFVVLFGGMGAGSLLTIWAGG